MEYTKGIKHTINGVFGEVTYTDVDLSGWYYPSRYNSEVQKKLFHRQKN